MKKTSWTATVAAILAFAAGSASAADITMTTSDASGTSSFNSGVSWPGGVAPASGNNYFTGAYAMRTPDLSADQTLTFAGDSLSVDAGGFFTYKTDTAGGTRTDSFTFNNGGLILNGGTVRNHTSASLKLILQGNLSVTQESEFHFPQTIQYAQTYEINSTITGASALKITSVTPTTSGGTRVVTLSGNNSGFSGGFKLGDGYTEANMRYTTLKVNHANALGTGELAMTYGNVDLNGFSTTIGGLSGVNSTGNTIRNNGETDATLTVGNAGNLSTSYAGVIADGTKKVKLVKDGTGILTLAGANTYTGGTEVKAGTLKLTGSLSATGDLVVQTGATVTGTGTINSSLTFDAGAKLDLTGAILGETSGDILTVAAGKAITLTNFGLANITGWDWAAADVGTYTLINGGSGVTLAGTTPTESSPYDFGNGKQGYFQQGSLQLVVIPEPATFGIVLGALAALVIRRRRMG